MSLHHIILIQCTIHTKYGIQLQQDHVKVHIERVFGLVILQRCEIKQHQNSIKCNIFYIEIQKKQIFI